MSKCFIEPHYLPSLAYFRLISEYDVIGIDIGGKFIKQTYRNRCKVLLSNKIGQLVIPIKNSSLGGSVSHVKIDYSENWSHVHWKSIESAYGKTPFFEHYRPYFEKNYDNPPEFLVDFVINNLKLCFKCLGWKKEIVLINTMGELGGFKDIKNLVQPKRKGFKFNSAMYHQAFGKGFVQDLSIIDALFNVGPECSELINSSELSISRFSGD